MFANNDREFHPKDRSKTALDLNSMVNHFDRSLSNSKLQIYDQDNFQGDNDTKGDSISKDFSLTVMENEQINFDLIQKQQEDKDIINQNDNIFKFLVNDQVLKRLSLGTKCSICNDEFNIIRPKRQCKFCGETVCDKHGRKKRSDPQDITQFHKICDMCEDKYIKLSVQENYIKKKTDLNNQLIEIEKKSHLISLEVRKKQELLQDQKTKIQTEQNTIKNSQNELTFKIQKIRQQNTQIKQETTSLEDKVKQLDNQIATIIERQSQKEQSIDSKQFTDTDTSNKIQAVDQDIKQINHLTEQINVNIAEKKIAQDRRSKQSEQMNREMQMEPKDTIYETYAQTEAKSPTQVKKKKTVKSKQIEEHIGDKEFCKGCILF